MRIAVIDIGTNTVLMTVVESETGAIIRDEHSIARLGEGVDQTHRISGEAYARFSAIMTRYSEIIRELGVKRVVPFATSAMRDAANRAEIIAKATQDLGYDIELLSGTDEARWGFRGALYGVSPEQCSGTIASIDIGGGSTEIALGTDGEYAGGVSLNMGAVRVKERFLLQITKDSVAKARTFIRTELLKASAVDVIPSLLIAVAGTPTSLAAMKHRLSSFDASIVDRTVLNREEVSALVDEMLAISSDELTNRYPAVSAARADILPAGALILDEAMRALGVASARVSTKGLRYGIILRELGE
jgi:exopolyphosphatase / guanosine-5'-triphosphate,3'-diphosphate pyrophosphatase